MASVLDAAKKHKSKTEWRSKAGSQLAFFKAYVNLNYIKLYSIFSSKGIQPNFNSFILPKGKKDIFEN